MAELYARQGRLGDAVRIYQRLLSQEPPADKVTRWTERCRSLERARAHAGDLELPPEPVPAPKRPAPPPRKPEPAAAPKADALGSLPSGPVVDDATDEMPFTPVADEPAAAAPVEATVEVIEEPHRLPLVITQPVRSGQVVYARKNDLIVLGSVNPGGQVVADGNIHIYGALRGRAIAGAQGAAEARIFCQRLEAELLAISGVYLIWDDIPRATLGKPAQVSLQGEICLVAPL
jgi:Septum formation inhibitor MinC, C-terminal domain